MDYQALLNELHTLAEDKYADFSGSLTPGAERMLGVRIPKLRAIAKRLAKEDWRGFLEAAKDDTFEEIMLQGFVIGYAKTDFATIRPYLERFIPKIHNWAVNDCFCATFKLAAKHQDEVWEFLMTYLEGTEEFPLRVVAVMLMDYYLNDVYIERVLKVYEVLAGKARSGYYLQMGIAWGIATAYIHYPERVTRFLNCGYLDSFTYRMTVRKMLESYRVSDEDKEVLRAMRKHPFWNCNLDMEARIDALLAELTLEEKVLFTTTDTPGIRRLGILPYSAGGEAAHGVEARHDQSFNLGDPVVTTSFPQPFGMSMMWDPALMEEIGEAVGIEVRIHGLIELEKKGKIGGLCRFAPTVDMERDPRWGRTEEGYGEDPFLTGKTAAAYVRGLRGKDEHYLRCGATLKHFYANNMETDRVSASSSVSLRDQHEYYLEPFRRCIEEGGAEAIMTAYNELNGIPAICDPIIQRYLKDTCGLPGYVLCDGGDMSQTVLFHHYFDSHAETVAAALKAGLDQFTEGAEIVVPAVKEALERGLLTEADLDRALRNSFRTRLRLGLYDPPEINPYASPDKRLLAGEKHAGLAAKAANEAVVLLKNENHFLPFSQQKGEKTAVIGPLADTWYLDWYGGIPPYRATVYDGLKTYLPKAECSCFDGLDRVRIRVGAKYLAADGQSGEVSLVGQENASVFIRNDWGDGGITFQEEKSSRFLTAVDELEQIRLGKTEAYAWFIKEAFHVQKTKEQKLVMDSWCGQPLFVDEVGHLCAHMRPEDMAVTGGQEDTLAGVSRNECVVTPAEFSFETVTDGIAEAVRMASEAERVVLCLGSNPVINAKEEIDRNHLHLPVMQENLLSAILEANPRTVLVLLSNYPYVLPECAKKLPAIIFSASGCQETGNALARVLTGKVNPAGRLSMSWIAEEKDLADIAWYDLLEGKRTYRYFEGAVCYPFGFGLSYSSFRYEELRGERLEYGLRFTVRVTNTSERDGDEVVQLYFRKSDACVKRPRKQLIAFARVWMEAGSTKEINLEVSERDLMYYDVIEERMLLEDGRYLFMAGADSQNTPLTCVINIDGEKRGCRYLQDRYPADHFDEQQGCELYQGKEPVCAVFARDAKVSGQVTYQNCRYEGKKSKNGRYLLWQERVTKDVRIGERRPAMVREESVALTDAEALSAIAQDREFTLTIEVSGSEGVRAFRLVPDNIDS